MLDPNILGALIGIIVTLLTLDVMMNLYKKMYHFTAKKTCSLFKIKGFRRPKCKQNKDCLKIIFED